MSFKSQVKDLAVNTKNMITAAPVVVDSLSSIALAGAAANRPARVMIGLGTTGLIVSTIVAPGIAAKFLVTAGVVGVSAGVIYGLRAGLRTVTKMGVTASVPTYTSV